MAQPHPGVSFEEELKKNPELKRADIQALQEWRVKKPHLPQISNSELALFLHSNYYRLEPTKTTIDTFYTLKTHVPEFFADRDPVASKSLQNIFKTLSIIPIEKRTREGYSIVISKLLDPDPSKYDQRANIKFFFMCIDLLMYLEGTTKGYVLLCDVSGLSFGHLARVNLTEMKKSLYFVQEALPIRLKGLHYMNTNPVMDVALNMAKPFMKKELIDLVHMHSSLESVDKFVPIEILPNEMGGEAGSMMELHDAYIKKLESYRDWFLEEEKRVRVDESKRPEKQINSLDLFGTEGSFKKLDID